MRITDFPLLSEIKEAYLEFRKNGMNRAAATNELFARYTTEIVQGEEDDGCIFWIGLADGQYVNKELTSEIAEHANSALNIVEQSGWGITPGDISRRRIWYSYAPMPEKAMGKRKTKFRCKWKVGDTFAYQLSDKCSEEKNVSGKYLLLRKVSDVEFGDGRLFPVVTLSILDKDSFPKNHNEFSNLTVLKINRGRFGLPDDLYEYRVELIIKNQKQLSSIPLIYIGNFEGVREPDDEVIIEGAGYMSMMHLERFDCDIYNRIKLSMMYEQESLKRNKLDNT